MVTEVRGDITQTVHGVILHQVNCMGKMGSGVAGAISKRFPKVKKEYLKFCDNHEREELLGKLQSVKVGEDLYVVNSYSQYYYGRNPDIKYTNEEILIENIRKTVEAGKEKGLGVYIPYKIGCGLGNGDWETVLGGIKDLDVTIVNLDG